MPSDLYHGPGENRLAVDGNNRERIAWLAAMVHLFVADAILEKVVQGNRVPKRFILPKHLSATMCVVATEHDGYLQGQEDHVNDNRVLQEEESSVSGCETVSVCWSQNEY